MAQVAVFATPEVGRIFLACDACQRVVPHYRAYGPPATARCRCGGTLYRPVRIPEWQAAWRVLVVGWLWRKTICRRTLWDPRMPVQQG